MPSSISNFNFSSRQLKKQHGVILMIMLILLVVGSSAFLVNTMSTTSAKMERDKKTMDTLAEAKQALISYAITYADTNFATLPVNGFLPCPDQGQNTTQDGIANNPCGAKNISQIGKLPWKTIGLSPPKDGSGECLWYAVSGNYKNKPPTDFMNWDTNGLFQVMASNGTSFLTGSSAENQAVAVIIAPDIPIDTQTRSTITGAPSCGGNYTASNYLDNDTIHNINNAGVSANANTLSQFIVGPITDVSNKIIVNDHVVYITKDDIFNVIKKRSDFGASINALMSQASACLSSAGFPAPKTINFDTMSESTGGTVGMMMGNQLVTGRIPGSTCTGLSNLQVQKWRDNLSYAICSSGMQCLSVNGSPCRRLIIFSGEKNLAQNRNTNVQKNTWSNYLEGAALNIFTTGASPVSGVSLSYSSASPSEDVWACL